MKITPFGIVWDMLKTIKNFRIFINKDNLLYLRLAVKAVKISESKYENEISNRTRKS